MEERPVKQRSRMTLRLGAVLLIASASVHADSQELPSDGTVQAEFPAPWMERMIQAYEDFRTTHDDLSCFKIRAYQKGDSYFVSIEPSKGVEVVDGKIKIPIAGWTPCGRGEIYEFDASGELLRQTLIK